MLVPQSELDRCVEAYEAARRVSGQVRVSDFLPPPSQPDFRRVLAELVRVDLEHGWTAGTPRPLDDYLREFPELRASPSLLGEVAFEEYRQRHEYGDNPTIAEYQAKYGIDTGGWADDEPQPGDGLRTQVIDRPPPPGLSPEHVTAAGRAYRRFRETTGPGADFYKSVGGALPPAAVRVFDALHQSSPAAARRLADAVTSFPTVGTEFAGFRLIGELGRGAFGRVYLAEQAELAGRLVALKVAADLTDEPQTLAQLQHTNIVPVYSIHKAGPLQAVCMPYFGSVTLADLLVDLKRQVSLPGSGHQIVTTLNNHRGSTRADSRRSNDSHEHHTDTTRTPAVATCTSTEFLTKLDKSSYVEAVLWLAAKMADGLGHAHERGIVHRDLKPANVLLTDEGQPMLLDFNLADDRNSNSPAAAAQVGGTLPYMAPEHLDAFRRVPGAVVDARSDVYSLGLMVFELLAGVHPFPTPAGPIKDVLPRMAARRREGSPRLRSHNPGVGPAVEAIVRKCLHPDPGRRYPSASALKEDVELHLVNRPLKYARNPSSRELVGKWLRRNRWVRSSGTLGVLTVAALLGLCGAVWAAREERQDRRAVDTHSQFQAESKRLTAALAFGTTSREPADLDAALAAGREALAMYGLPENPDWDSRREVTRLPTARRESLRRELGDFLFLMAQGSTLRARLAGDKGGPWLAEGAEFADLAVECFPPGQAPTALRGTVPTAGTVAAPRSHHDAYLAAAALVAQGHYRDARPLAEYAVAGTPDHFPAQFTLANCLLKLELFAKAEAVYGTCLALEPGYHWASYNRGVCRLRMGDYPGAKADLDRVLTERPHLIAARIDRGLAREGLGDLRGAISDLDRAARASPPQPRALLARARVKAKAGDQVGAAADTAAGLATPPADAQNWVARASVQADSDPVAALSAANTALKLDPNSRMALSTKATILGDHLGHTAEAVDVLNHAVEKFPAVMSLRTRRAMLRAQLGDVDAAVREAEECFRKAPGGETAYALASASASAWCWTGRDTDRTRALDRLRDALASGVGRAAAGRDSAFDALRADPQFVQVVENLPFGETCSRGKQ